MKLLLDTAAVIWIATNQNKVSVAAQTAYRDRANTAYISVVSVWEMLVKNRLGKLPLPSPIPDLLRPMRDHGVSIVGLTERAVLCLEGLPDLHRDPFDRMLICQAIEEDLTILTPDPLIRSYPVRSLW